MRRASLNHAYRLVWSDLTQAYVAVAEHTKSRGKHKALSVAIALALAPALSGAQVLVNDDPINAIDIRDDADASAIGIQISDGVPFAGALTNHSSIKAGATTSGYMAEATGIFVSDSFSGTVTNAAGGSIDAQADGTLAQAAGIAIHGEISTSGAIVNSGIIKAGAIGDAAYANGIELTGSAPSNPPQTPFPFLVTPLATIQGLSVPNAEIANQMANFSNLESIDATAEGVTQASANGIGLNGYLNATVGNAGTITASALTSGTMNKGWKGGSALANGIELSGSLTGSISNSGTINVDATAAAGGFAMARAIAIDSGATLDGNITNSKVLNAETTFNASNTVSGEVEFDGAEGYATGIQLGFHFNGSTAAVLGNILNADTITAHVAMTGAGSNQYIMSGDGAEGYATGIWVQPNGFVSGNLDNQKTISATIDIADGAEGYAAGVKVQGQLAGNFNNAGSINATATANLVDLASGSENNEVPAFNMAFAEGATLYMPQETVSNEGTIKAEATGAIAVASGVQIGVPYPFGLGLAAASFDAPLNANAAADVSTLFSNSKTGKIEAIAKGYYASAVGLYVDDAQSNQKIVNAGSITATATGVEGTGAPVYATGVFVDELSGILENTGTIGGFVSANNGGSAQAAGLGMQYLSGTVNNAGTIIASTATGDNAYSIQLYSGEGGAINNLVTGRLIGGIDIEHSGTSFSNNGQLILKNGVDLNNVNNTGRAAHGYIAGDYMQGATGTLHIAATSSQNGNQEPDNDSVSIAIPTTQAAGYSQLVIGGTASISGKAFVDVSKGHTLKVGQVLEDVVSAGSLSGDFTSISDNSALLNFQSRIDGNTIDFVAVKGKTVAQIVNERGNRSGKGVAAVLDALRDGGLSSDALREFAEQLDSLDDQALSDQVSKLVPLLTGGTDHQIRDALKDVSRIIQARQEGQVGRSSGDGFFGDKKVWIKPFGSWADQGSRNGVAGYDADTYGMVFGIDSEFNFRDRVGLAFSYSATDIDGKGAANQSADIDSYQLIAYGSRSLNDATDINFQAGLGLHRNKGRRELGAGFGAASARYDSWSANLGLGLARTVKFSEATSFTPSARVDYTMIRSETYDETGPGGIALVDVNSRDTEALVVGVDGKVVHALNDRASLTANLGVGYDLLNERASITAAFAGAPGAAFTTPGIDPSPWLARGGLGMVGKVTDTLEVTARYDFEVREDFSNQTVSVKARWSF